MKIDPNLLAGGTARVIKTTGVNAASLGSTPSTTAGMNLSPASPANDPSGGGLSTTLTEDAWHELVATAATSLGWTVAHCRKVLCKNGDRTWWETTMPKGWPDLFLVNGEASLFVELKTDTGRQSKEQKQWQAMLEGAGHAYLVWRPRDWDGVQKFLRGGVT